jgi:hypothetical protein
MDEPRHNCFKRLTIMGRVEPPQMMKCRLAPDRSLTPTLSPRERASRSAYGAHFLR